MRASQSIFRVRRDYNQWVGNETLEDYALRFTAKKARRWGIDKIGKTALGATAFLALEALAATATLQYGFINTLFAMLSLAVVILITGIPISYYAAKYGLDIDLLTRGAGFGYLGSTITSLIYATFTFIFFAIEAAILASALQALFGIPLYIGYVICVFMVVPIVIHGITAISRFQVGTQPMWLLLQLSALLVAGFFEFSRIDDWTQYAPAGKPEAGSFNLALFGACSSLLFAMVAQIGEQVDYLRFLPEKNEGNKRQWWFWMLMSGPGWILVGLPKMLFGSFLAYLAITSLIPYEKAIDPIYMYQMTFNYVTHSPTFSLILAGVMVIISQMKINVTNAYAGSIAWSNFFSRLTHSHPGRVVWLVFNVAIALMLMELGIYRVLEAILGIFAIVAISWLGCLSADLLINKPLKLSPQHIEYKRSHLYDINPVGFVSMILASVIGILAYLGHLGESSKHLSHYISLLTCFIAMPLMAIMTRGKYYLARHHEGLIVTQEAEIFDPLQSASAPGSVTHITCCICENNFETEDMSHCPAYGGNICSLCCSLDGRCLDRCKTDARFSDQLANLIGWFVPSKAMVIAQSRVTRFIGLFAGISLLVGAFLALVFFHMEPATNAERELLQTFVWAVFYILLIITGVISWLFLLAHESRLVAQHESNRQTALLMEEIEAHKETDSALQQAKEHAEQANEAKSRYLSGISHELRTPLQSMLGYAQLLQNQQDIPQQHQRALKIIRNSGEHLTDLIEGLLEISKIEAGRLDIYRNYIPIQELLSQLVDIFRQQAEDKGLSFHYHQHNPLPVTVIADEKRLRQILINLLSNAVKYTIKGRIDFHVYYRYQIAEFSVMDTGVGIRSEDLKRILNPFERIRNRDVPMVTGTGLGLTIVQLLTEVLGGNLKVKSTPKYGSCFTVTLMLSKVDGPVEVDTRPQKDVIGYRGERKTALVVDDEAIHRGLVSDILSPVGVTTYEAQDGYECLELLRVTQPDIFILDVNLPGMSGLELAQTLRESGIQAPILMLSADATEQHRSQNNIKPHNEYMTKPIRTRSFIEMVGNMLDIEWVFSMVNNQPPENRSAATIVRFEDLPPDPLLTSLLEQAQIGHKKGFVKILFQVEQQSLLNSEQVNYLRNLADDMRFDKIEQLLDPQYHEHT